MKNKIFRHGFSSFGLTPSKTAVMWLFIEIFCLYSNIMHIIYKHISTIIEIIDGYVRERGSEQHQALGAHIQTYQSWGAAHMREIHYIELRPWPDRRWHDVSNISIQNLPATKSYWTFSWYLLFTHFNIFEISTHQSAPGGDMKICSWTKNSTISSYFDFGTDLFWRNIQTWRNLVIVQPNVSKEYIESQGLGY